MTAHRFAADTMLGHLATWLRLIGQDTAYGSHLSGKTLLRLARAEQRIVLTRDTRLGRHADLPLLFVVSNDFRDQLRQVIATYQIDAYAALFARCTCCNVPLRTITRDEAATAVPPYVAETALRFERCPRCRRIYWPGTHQERIRTELRSMGFPEV